MGETRVDLQHLLEDLRDAYPGALEETILTEMVANALDSGATAVAFVSDPVQSTLTVVDNGAGMDRRELSRYHNIAASTKTRGEGIGFAGVGIKLGLWLRRGPYRDQTRQEPRGHHLVPGQQAPCALEVGDARGSGRGSRHRCGSSSRTCLAAARRRLYRSAVRHFQPLLDSAEGRLHTTRGRALPGQRAEAAGVAGKRAPLSVRLGRKRKPGRGLPGA